MQFDWKVRSLAEWEKFYQMSPQCNWMQTWAYAQASFKVDYLRSRLALIVEDETPLGMMCVQSITLGPIKIVNLKRGPIWFKTPSLETFAQFAKTFRQEFPKSTFLRLRWIPEFDLSSAEKCSNEFQLETFIKELGFKLRSEYFLTSWLDLNLSVEALRKQLDQKWRNCLNKAEKQDIRIQVDQTLQNKEKFFSGYVAHLKTKNYKGPSVAFLQNEFLELEKSKSISLLWACKDSKPVAAIAIGFHGSTASYRLGWNSPQGRMANTHYLLLWKALLLAKERGLKRFDIGGLLPDDAPGVTHFKKGLGGGLSHLVTLS